MAKTKSKNKGETNKTIFIVGGILIAIVLVCVVGYTYSRYTSQATGTATAKVANWAIQVNDTDIVQNAEFTLDDSYITWSDSEYVEDGYIAPGSTGTMRIRIDASGSQVAVKYTVTIDDSALDSYSQIKITKVNNQPVSGDTYSGIIALDDVDTPVEIPIEITWTNDDGTNASDTTIGSTVDTLEIPITVTAEQYLG